MLLTGSPFLSLLSYLSDTARACLPRDGTTLSILSPPVSISNEEMIPRLDHLAILDNPPPPAQERYHTVLGLPTAITHQENETFSQSRSRFIDDPHLCQAHKNQYKTKQSRHSIGLGSGWQEPVGRNGGQSLGTMLFTVLD